MVDEVGEPGAQPAQPGFVLAEPVSLWRRMQICHGIEDGQRPAPLQLFQCPDELRGRLRRNAHARQRLHGNLQDQGRQAVFLGQRQIGGSQGWMQDRSHVSIHVGDVHPLRQRPHNLRPHLGSGRLRIHVRVERGVVAPHAALFVEQPAGRISSENWAPALDVPLAVQREMHAKIRLRGSLSAVGGDLIKPRARHHDRPGADDILIRDPPERLIRGMAHSQVVGVRDDHTIVGTEPEALEEGIHRLTSGAARPGGSRSGWRNSNRRSDAYLRRRRRGRKAGTRSAYARQLSPNSASMARSSRRARKISPSMLEAKKSIAQVR